MAFAEHGHEKIRSPHIEQPARYLTLEARAGDQIVADPAQRALASIDGYLTAHRMCSKAIDDVARQPTLIRFHFRERIVTAEVGYFDPSVEVSPQTDRHVERSDRQATSLELRVKWLDGKPIRGDA